MKLLAKYNRVNISVTIIVFLIGSIGFYFVLHYVLVRQLDDALRAEQQEVTSYVTQNRAMPFIQNTRHQWIEIQRVEKPVPITKPSSAQRYNPREREYESVRQLVFPLTVQGTFYAVTVNKSEAETEDMLQLIVMVTLTMIFLILLFNYIINRRMVRRLWQPFYNTITAIRDYRLLKPLHLPREKIEEVSVLNESLNAMTERIHGDYQALRSLTENASHEMQTPLAVIHSKVESLLQDMEQNERSMQQLMAIEDATRKLSKLYQSLLLLAKLENRQFLTNETVNLTAIINNKVDDRRELLPAKDIRLDTRLSEVTLQFHHHLAEILVSNLLNNAIRYTPPGGSILVELTAEKLSFSNTAINGSLNSQNIFQRFYKEHKASEGTGLGLAIVQEICHLAGFKVGYHYNDHAHDFTVNFS